MANLIHDIIAIDTQQARHNQPAKRSIISKLRQELHVPKPTEAISKKLASKKTAAREAELIDIVSRFRTRH